MHRAMVMTFIVWAMTASAAPPLSEQQQRDLAAARDGSDHRDQAVFAVVESVRTWPAPAAQHSGAASPWDDGEPLHLLVDPAALNARPEDFRGELFRIEGELLQQTPLAPPYEDVTEWFIREARTMMPVIVYVVGQDDTDVIALRQRVRIDGRFVKRVRFSARDGTVRDYPAFVGRSPTSLGEIMRPAYAVSTPGFEALWIVGAVVAALLVAFVIVRVWVTRQAQTIPARARSSSRLRVPATTEDPVDDAADLPDDPIEALAELKRRADS